LQEVGGRPSINEKKISEGEGGRGRRAGEKRECGTAKKKGRPVSQAKGKKVEALKKRGGKVARRLEETREIVPPEESCERSEYNKRLVMKSAKKNEKGKRRKKAPLITGKGKGGIERGEKKRAIMMSSVRRNLNSNKKKERDSVGLGEERCRKGRLGKDTSPIQREKGRGVEKERHVGAFEASARGEQVERGRERGKRINLWEAKLFFLGRKGRKLAKTSRQKKGEPPRKGGERPQKKKGCPPIPNKKKRNEETKAGNLGRGRGKGDSKHQVRDSKSDPDRAVKGKKAGIVVSSVRIGENKKGGGDPAT